MFIFCFAKQSPHTLSMFHQAIGKACFLYHIGKAKQQRMGYNQFHYTERSETFFLFHVSLPLPLRTTLPAHPFSFWRPFFQHRNVERCSRLFFLLPNTLHLRLDITRWCILYFYIFPSVPECLASSLCSLVWCMFFFILPAFYRVQS
jgi:hypothetical protein